MSVTEESENRREWFAIRVTYSRELMVKSYLDDCGIENYIPMHPAERTVKGIKRKILVPLIHNLIFIRTSARKLKLIKAGTDLPIRYIMNRENRQPVIIPERQMRDFMTVVDSQNEFVEIVVPQTADFSKGDPVRVTGGPFAGIEGRYIRHKGHSKVAVEIRGIATALTAFVPTKYIEKL